MNEHMDPAAPDEHSQSDEPDQQQQRALTQRELVMASLLRCPPQDQPEQPPR